MIGAAWCRYERTVHGRCFITRVSPPVLIVPDSWTGWITDVVISWNGGMSPVTLCDRVGVPLVDYHWGLITL